MDHLLSIWKTKTLDENDLRVRGRPGAPERQSRRWSWRMQRSFDERLRRPATWWTIGPNWGKITQWFSSGDDHDSHWSLEAWWLGIPPCCARCQVATVLSDFDSSGFVRGFRLSTPLSLISYWYMLFFSVIFHIVIPERFNTLLLNMTQSKWRKFFPSSCKHFPYLCHRSQVIESPFSIYFPICFPFHFHHELTRYRNATMFHLDLQEDYRSKTSDLACLSRAFAGGFRGNKQVPGS